ncbi:hypothetical protein J2046_005643 [Rhizobium petrolearium]|nr:hypothetical protein [Neorhizobium petrolearium]
MRPNVTSSAGWRLPKNEAEELLVRFERDQGEHLPHLERRDVTEATRGATEETCAMIID